jgi:alpha-glucosidase (family GH31 glycosyl hydrolase)
MRPLWYEFPGDMLAFNITTIFMWGDSILVAPKLSGSVNIDSDLYDKGQTDDKNYVVDLYLPSGASWYNYFTKLIETTSGSFEERYLSIKELAVYVRAGSIIPIKLHYKKLALLRVY